MKQIDLAYRTIYSELLQRSMDASFHNDFPIIGRFVSVPVKGKRYWYFDMPEEAGVKRRYIGPENDAEITKRVQAFKEIKDDFKSRRKLVSTLTREAGLPAPERFVGDIVETLARAGLFRLQGVLIGTAAFQSYPALLGVKFPANALQTGNADVAQFHSISAVVGDNMPPMLDVLRQADETFREISHIGAHIGDSRKNTQYINRTRYKVEFLTSNTGKDGDEGNTSAHPIKFLDFLIQEPEAVLLLHNSGVVVMVPSPERYAVHKLIVASRRGNSLDDRSKRERDIHQATLLTSALNLTRRHIDLAIVFSEAWNRETSWREAIRKGLAYMTADSRALFENTVLQGLEETGERLEGFIEPERNNLPLPSP